MIDPISPPDPWHRVDVRARWMEPLCTREPTDEHPGRSATGPPRRMPTWPWQGREVSARTTSDERGPSRCSAGGESSRPGGSITNSWRCAGLVSAGQPAPGRAGRLPRRHSPTEAGPWRGRVRAARAGRDGVDPRLSGKGPGEPAVSPASPTPHTRMGLRGFHDVRCAGRRTTRSESSKPSGTDRPRRSKPPTNSASSSLRPSKCQNPASTELGAVQSWNPTPEHGRGHPADSGECNWRRRAALGPPVTCDQLRRPARSANRSSASITSGAVHTRLRRAAPARTRMPASSSCSTARCAAESATPVVSTA